MTGTWLCVSWLQAQKRAAVAEACVKEGRRVHKLSLACVAIIFGTAGSFNCLVLGTTQCSVASAS